MKLIKSRNNITNFKNITSEFQKDEHNIQKVIKRYYRKYGIEPNIGTISQITGKIMSDLKEKQKHSKSNNNKTHNLEATTSPEMFNLLYLVDKDKHKTYFMYHNQLKKYLPMKILDIIYHETNESEYIYRKSIQDMIVKVKYPETGWEVLIIPDSEICNYYYGRVIVNFKDFQEQAFYTLEDAIDAIKIWKANLVEVTDKPDRWSAFSQQQIKRTDITKEVSVILPDQIVLEEEPIDKNLDILADVDRLNKEIKIDKKKFAEIQQEKPGFRKDMITLNEYIDISKKVDEFGIEHLNFSEKIKKVFVMIFGLYNEHKNLDKALSIAKDLFNCTRMLNPFEDLNNEFSDPFIFYSNDELKSNEKYLSWLKNIGHLSVLIGTIYAYKNEVIKSCYFFMQGLKTEMLTLSDEYYNFMNYMFEKLHDIPKIKYSKQSVKYISYDNESISKAVQKRIIADVVNDNNDIIMAHYQHQKLFGYLKQKKDNAYETWIITNEFELKNIEFELIAIRSEPIVLDVGANFSEMTFQIEDSFRIKINSELFKSNFSFRRTFKFNSNYNIVGFILPKNSIEFEVNNQLHPIY